MNIKRYVVFAGKTFYPRGGGDDFVGDYDELWVAQKIAESRGTDEEDPYVWAHVWDAKRKEIVYEVREGRVQTI